MQPAPLRLLTSDFKLKINSVQRRLKSIIVFLKKLGVMIVGANFPSSLDENGCSDINVSLRELRGYLYPSPSQLVTLIDSSTTAIEALLSEDVRVSCKI
jgi:hypothetical protein